MKYGFQSPQAEEFPPIIILDLTNICNLECIHCPQAKLRQSPNYTPKFLDWDVYVKIIDEIAQNEVIVVRYTGDGEPLLHPRFLEMIAYAKEKGAKPLNLTTNGFLLDKEMASELLKLNIDVIDISLDAYSKEKYEKIRKGSNFDKVISNVHFLIECREKITVDTKIMVSIINQPEASGEIEPFKQYWEPLVDRVLVRNFINIHNMVDIAQDIPDEKINRYPCPQLWKRITVNTFGYLKFCGTDFLNESVIANLMDGGITIRNVWKSQLYQQLREYHLQEEFKKVPICSDCTDWLSSPWDYGYEYAIKKVIGK